MAAELVVGGRGPGTGRVMRWAQAFDSLLRAVTRGGNDVVRRVNIAVARNIESDDATTVVVREQRSTHPDGKQSKRRD